MTEEIIVDGVNVWSCKHYDLENNYCDQSYLGEDGLLKNTKNPKRCEQSSNCYYKQLKRLEQENKSLYEEKNCLHKIIDRLLENSGYSKDVASAEDFEDVYEDMQIKRNELIELEQEKKELKAYKDVNEDFKKAWDELNRKYTEVLKLAKENADSYEFCMQELEKELEPFQDDYFNGLTKQQIAGLAKKSIRITKENRDLVYALERIKFLVQGHDYADESRLRSIEKYVDEVLDVEHR